MQVREGLPHRSDLQWNLGRHPVRAEGQIICQETDAYRSVLVGWFLATYDHEVDLAGCPLSLCVRYTALPVVGVWQDRRLPRLLTTQMFSWY